MYENGSVIVNTQEADILLRIFDMYLDGMSLQQIGQNLNADNVEYQSGVINWNKSRIMRIIEDGRYTGTNTYPAIINKSLHRALVEEKDTRNTQIHTNRSSGIYVLEAPVICPECGSGMHRRNDSRCKCPQRWVCKSTTCRLLIPYADSDMLASITAILNHAIYNPEMIEIPEPKAILDTESLRLESKINHALCSPDFDRNTLRQTILDCASLKFRELDQAVNISKRLKADFENTNPLSSFSVDLFTRTVKSIHFSGDRTIRLKLKNGQFIAKE